MVFKVRLTPESAPVDVDAEALHKLVTSGVLVIAPAGGSVEDAPTPGRPGRKPGRKPGRPPGRPPKTQTDENGAPKRRPGRPRLTDEEKARRKAEREAAKAEESGDEAPKPRKRGRPRKRVEA